MLKLLTFLIIGVLLFLASANFQGVNIDEPRAPSPTPVVLKEAVPADEYTIILIGDSMTAALGPNTDKLREYLKGHYGEKPFGIFNLSTGSTNILTVQERLKDVLGRESEIIILESFGYNPLSDLPRSEGLKKQTEELDKIVASIRNAKSKAKVNSIMIFLATIAPNSDNYGKGAVDLSPEERHKWADERSAYIKNHIEYAKTHDIPLVNVYEKSLNEEGTGSLEYIEGATFIHPNENGIDLISKEIADFLFNMRILPP